MKQLPVLLVAVVVSCGRTGEPRLPRKEPTHVLLRDSFTGATLGPGWIVVAPDLVGATARVADASVILTMPAGSNDQLILRHRFDVLTARGQRIRWKARVRMNGEPQSFARAAVSLVTASTTPTYHDHASSSPTSSSSWVDVHAVIDVPADATSGQIDLVLHGAGTARFEAAEVTAVGAAPPPDAIDVSPQQIENLVTFTRAATLIRYLHPSDEAAALDWNAFLPAAIERILRVRSQAELLAQLRAMFLEISPTAVFSSRERLDTPLLLPRGEATHLVRWRRYGLGNTLAFTTFREGRDVDAASASALIRLPLDSLRACRQVSFRARAHRLPGPGKALLLARVLRPAGDRDDQSAPVQDGETSLSAELPQDAQAVELGLHVDGRSGATLEYLAVSCDHKAERAVDIARAEWMYTEATDLYTWKVSACDGQPCARLQRNELDTEFRPERDVLHQDIGNGISIHLPLGVWADASRTLPVVARAAVLDDFTIDDAPTRLAAISAGWGTLSLFYPYFSDQHIDWLAALPGALREAAAARSPAETRVALAHLMADLHDNHAKITHPGAPITGILPIEFRRFGDKIIVVGGLPEYLATIKVGSEFMGLDGVSAELAFERAAKQVSAATEGLHEYLTPARMTMGYPGTFHTLAIRGPDGRVVEHVLPYVNDNLYAHMNREPRPAEHAELAPGVHYVDLDSLTMASWQKMLPSLEHARAIILDFRGYTTLSGLEVLAHIAKQELHSPEWQTPVVPDIAGIKYSAEHWDVRPRAPRLNAKIVGLIDGRSMSAVETQLHLFREGNFGILVGETSAGTNGNAAYIEVPGEFTLRFTGLRTAFSDGSTVHGHGFKPDHEVHPTLDGVRAGRDEILEAGLAVAKRLINP
jgi:hypothetical protein